jgi:hypothetical protein
MLTELAVPDLRAIAAEMSPKSQSPSYAALQMAYLGLAKASKGATFGLAPLHAGPQRHESTRRTPNNQGSKAKGEERGGRSRAEDRPCSLQWSGLPRIYRLAGIYRIDRRIGAGKYTVCVEAHFRRPLR